MNGEWNGLQALFMKDCPCGSFNKSSYSRFERKWLG